MGNERIAHTSVRVCKLIYMTAQKHLDSAVYRKSIKIIIFQCSHLRHGCCLIFINLIYYCLFKCEKNLYMFCIDNII